MSNTVRFTRAVFALRQHGFNLLRDRLSFAGIRGPAGPLPEAVVLKTWNDVQMCVEDELAGGGVTVDDEIYPVGIDRFFDRRSEFFGDREHMGKRFVGCFKGVCIVGYRNDLGMAGIGWFDVEKGVYDLVLIDPQRGEFFSHDFAENAVTHNFQYTRKSRNIANFLARKLAYAQTSALCKNWLCSDFCVYTDSYG